MREWTIEHNGHFAWFQRSLMAGDFAPGRQPVSHYVIRPDGRADDPSVAPKCETCGKVPNVDDLIAIETATGDSYFLEPFRKGHRKWPRPTSLDTCWWCNTPNAGAVGNPPLCTQCAEHLAGR